MSQPAPERTVLPAPGVAAPAAQPRRTVPAARASRWDPLTIAIAVFIATAVGRIHQIFGFLTPLRPVMVSGVLALILVVASSHPQRTLQRSWTRPLVWLSCFVIWAILTIPGSLWPGGSFQLLFDDFVKTGLIVVVTVVAVRDPRDVERLMLTYAMAAAVYATIAIRRLGGGGGRIESFYTYDANDFAVYAVTAIPLALYFTRRGHPALVRVAAALGSASLLVTFLRTQSRGGFLAILAMALVLLFTYRSVSLRNRLLVAGVSLLLFTRMASDSYWERIRTIFKSEEDYNRTAEGGRIQLWKRGIGYMMSRPIFGVGAGQFGSAEGRLSPMARRQAFGMGLKWSTAHNTYVQIGAELGVPGILFYLFFVAAVIRAIMGLVMMPSTAARSPPSQAQVLLASAVGFLVGAIFLSLAYYTIFYMLAALVVGLAKVCAPRPGGSHTAAPGRRLRAVR